MKRKFLVHVVLNIEDSKRKIKELKEKGFVIIGAEVPKSLGLNLDYNIDHTINKDNIDTPACVNAFEFRKLTFFNAIIISKPDLDALMVVAILRKIAYKQPFTSGELLKIDLIARQDISKNLTEKEHETIAQIFGELKKVKFYEKWTIVYKWLIGELELGQSISYKSTRQVILEKYEDILVVVTFGLGAFSYPFLDSHRYVVAFNPDHYFMSNNNVRGRRYCIGSKTVDLKRVQEQLDKVEPGWGGHVNIICSNTVGPSKLEIYDIIKILRNIKED